MNLEQAKAIFKLAGFPDCRVFETKNPYWGDRNAEAGPQYAFLTKEGVITIHWRKRVLEINWEDTDVRYPIGDQYGRAHCAIESITRDETTKESTLVHAWSYGKAVDYLAEFRRHFKRDEYVKGFAIRKENGTLTEDEKDSLKYYTENPAECE